MKRVFLKTYGCAMNERDSEAVAALLERRGYAITESEDDADIVLLNTCSVRDLAEQKAVGKMRALVGNRRRARVLGFMGCMAQSRGVEIVRELPGVSLVVGTQRCHHVPDHLDRLLAGAGPVVDVAAEPGSESAMTEHRQEGAVTAWVNIMQGCNMACTFCIVPQTRGTERSRSVGEIVDEVRQLVDTGVKEVTLLGQIVTSYGRKRGEFARLLAAVQEVPGLERIRFTSPHPHGFGADLVAAYRDLPKLCEQAHLPVQSGSDRILKAMKRGYTRAAYLRIIEQLRGARPGMAFSTDIIVGFPGETDEDFAATLALMRAVEFEQAYLFKYSKRRNTPAATLPGQLTTAVKEARHRQALDLLNEIALRRNQALIGQTVEVLVEGRSPKRPERLFGRTRTNKGVVFAGPDSLKGRLVPVSVERATTVTLYGSVMA